MTHHIRYRSPIQTADRPGDELDRIIASKGEEGFLLMMLGAGQKTSAPKLPRSTPNARYEDAKVARDQLLSCIKEHGPMCQQEMVGLSGLDKNKVAYHLSRLVSGGQVENSDPTRRRGIQWRAVE